MRWNNPALCHNPVLYQGTTSVVPPPASMENDLSPRESEFRPPLHTNIRANHLKYLL